MTFRQVVLPDDIPGRLYLHSMPGLQESLADSWDEIARLSVRKVVCLAPLDEIRHRSPDYAAAIEKGAVPCEIRRFPICDYQGPDDDHAFRQLAVDVAGSLRQGDAVLLHCGAGIGRTGTLAIATLIVLGLSPQEARTRVKTAGSEPERQAQDEALRRFVESLGGHGQP